VKGISDDHEAMLPPTIERWTRPDGSTRLFAVAGALLTGQTSVRQLAVMRRASRRAIEHAAERLMPWITDASEHAH